MRNLFLTTLVSLFLVNSIIAQSTPSTPETPITSVSTSKSTSYSITFDTDDKEDNSSISIKRNDDIYKFNARFHESKTGSIKKLLVDKLGNENLKIFGDTYRWIKKENGEKLYDCKLTDSTLKIYVDKEFANSKIIDMMDEFGVLLKDAISGGDSKEDERKRAEKDLERAKRDLERAKRDLERAKRKVKKSK